jgi:hypothetical protein
MTRELQQPTPEQRTNVPFVGDERSSLDAWLDWHRATLIWKCEGLSGPEMAARSVEPSTMSLLGLVRHMTDVERSWWRWVVAGEDIEAIYCRPDAEEADFDETDPATAEAAIRVLEEEIELCRAAVAGAGLDDVAARQRHGKPVGVRWVYLHMIEEYARHNGHADLLRERIDGTIGD